MPVPAPVVVAGAGPTGLVAALLLARRGVGVTVLERRTGVHPLPRAVHLDDESVRILQAAGVADGFTRISRPAAGLRLLDARLRPFAEFRRSGRGLHGWPESNLFDQPDLEALLRRAVADEPRIVLREAVEVLGVEPPGAGAAGTTGVRPGVAAADRPGTQGGGACGATGPGAARPPGGAADEATGGDGARMHRGGAYDPTGACGAGMRGGGAYGVRLTSGERVPAAAVLGCDGANSTVRAAVGARMRELGFAERWFVVDVRTARPLPGWGGVDQVCDPARAATSVPLPGDRHRWEFRMHAREDAAALAARVPDLVARWAPGPVEVLRAGEYTFAARVADRWSDGLVFLLGDAAHLTPPFIGQGLGAGLRDAHNLAWKLAAVLGDGAPESWVDGYRYERAPHAEAMIRGAVRVGRAMTGGSGAVAALRRPVVAGALRIPAVRRRAAAGLVTRLAPGALVDRRRHRRDPAGTICPQPWPGHDALLGDGWALLAGSGPVPDDLAHRAAAVGARTVRTAEPSLLRWLADGRITAALLRPDRVVAATAPA